MTVTQAAIALGLTKQEALDLLTESGMTDAEALTEFNATVSYYLGGTMGTAADRKYAQECAIESILNGCEEIDDETETMRQIMRY